MKHLLTIVAIALGLALPANVHAQAGLGGITLPSFIDGMSAVQSGNPRLKEFVQSSIYQNASDRIVVNVFQANFPNVGIWHEAHKTRALALFDKLSVTQTRELHEAAVHSKQPNGISEVFSLSTLFSSTAIATIGFNRWIVTIHATSKSMSPKDQATRLDKIIQSITPDKLHEKNYSLKPPLPCEASEEAMFEQEGTAPLQQKPFMASLIESVQLAIAKADATGNTAGGGLSMNPDQFCKARSASGLTVWYQSKRKLGLPKWIQLVSSTGLAVEGFAVPDEGGKADQILIGGVIAHGYRTSTVASLHSGFPNPISAQLDGLAALAQTFGAN